MFIAFVIALLVTLSLTYMLTNVSLGNWISDKLRAVSRAVKGNG